MKHSLYNNPSRLFALLLAIVALVLPSTSASAQTLSDRLHCQVGVGYSLPLADAQGRASGLYLRGDYDLHPRLSVGVGTRLSHHLKNLLPLYGHLQWRLTRQRLFTPHLEGLWGYAPALSTQARGGCCWSLGLGTCYRLRDRHLLSATLSIDHQTYSRRKTFSSTAVRSTYVEPLCHNALALRLGYQF